MGPKMNIVPFPRKDITGRPAQLEFGERLFLWGFRAMAQHHRCGRPILAAMRRVYGQYHVEDAVASLDALVGAFALTAHTAIAIHNPCCPCISEGETFLLRAMAAAQSADLHAARRDFGRWLPELAADWVLSPACGIGGMFKANGITLPLRKAATTEAEALSWSIGSDTFH
jgi:hypothetical protein